MIILTTSCAWMLPVIVRFSMNASFCMFCTSPTGSAISVITVWFGTPSCKDEATTCTIGVEQDDICQIRGGRGETGLISLIAMAGRSRKNEDGSGEGSGGRFWADVATEISRPLSHAAFLRGEKMRLRNGAPRTELVASPVLSLTMLRADVLVAQARHNPLLDAAGKTRRGPGRGPGADSGPMWPPTSHGPGAAILRSRPCVSSSPLIPP